MAPSGNRQSGGARWAAPPQPIEMFDPIDTREKINSACAAIRSSVKLNGARGSLEGDLQVGALLLELGVVSGERRLLVLGDGASWIRSWFEGLGMAPKAMIVCWWHLRKRCYESMSTAGGAKDRRRTFEKELLGQLWEGKVDAAIELLRGALEWVRTPQGVEVPDFRGTRVRRRSLGGPSISA